MNPQSPLTGSAGLLPGGGPKKMFMELDNQLYFFWSHPPGRGPGPGPIAGVWGLIEIGGLGDQIPLTEEMVWGCMMWCCGFVDRWWLMDFCVGIMRASIFAKIWWEIWQIINRYLSRLVYIMKLYVVCIFMIMSNRKCKKNIVIYILAIYRSGDIIIEYICLIRYI